MDHSMRDDAVALGLVMQNVMCGNIWQQCVWASMIFFFSSGHCGSQYQQLCVSCHIELQMIHNSCKSCFDSRWHL